MKGKGDERAGPASWRQADGVRAARLKRTGGGGARDTGGAGPTRLERTRPARGGAGENAGEFFARRALLKY